KATAQFVSTGDTSAFPMPSTRTRSAIPQPSFSSKGCIGTTPGISTAARQLAKLRSAIAAFHPVNGEEGSDTFNGMVGFHSCGSGVSGCMVATTETAPIKTLAVKNAEKNGARIEKGRRLGALQLSSGSARA
ncbi:MAG: hypothetical protein KJP02_05750, partial [Octadecabacter sp.]|nr:hypothetical protein [Octadecabacter sp.]